MDGREGRGVLVYLLLDVASDGEARELAEKLGGAMGEVDDSFVGYAVSAIEPVELTFEAEGAGATEADDGG
jgi:hypothetical protein